MVLKKSDLSKVNVAAKCIFQSFLLSNSVSKVLQDIRINSTYYYVMKIKKNRFALWSSLVI